MLVFLAHHALSSFHIYIYTCIYTYQRVQGGRPPLSRTQGRLNLGGVNGMGATQIECQPYWDEQTREVGAWVRGCVDWLVYW